MCNEKTQVNELEYRLFNECDKEDTNTIYGELLRIAINTAIFRSFCRMADKNNINSGQHFSCFIKDSHYCDLVMSIGRLVDSNYVYDKSKNIRSKKSNGKLVNSLTGFLEDILFNDNYLSTENESKIKELLAELNMVKSSSNLVRNKIFGHSDLSRSNEISEINTPTYNQLLDSIRTIHRCLILGAELVNIKIPGKLTKGYNSDWSEAFSEHFYNYEFNDSDIWDEL